MSMRAPKDSAAPPPTTPPAVVPVLLLTLGLAMVSLSRVLGLVLVTLLSCVSACVGDTAMVVAGSLPSLLSTLILAGGRPLGQEEEGVGGSVGGSLNFPPSRRRVVGAGFAVGSFFWEGGGPLRTPAYWRTEPSPSLSSCSSTSIFPALGMTSTLAAWSRRLNTPVGCKNTSVKSTELIFKTHNDLMRITDRSHLVIACWCVCFGFSTKSCKYRRAFQTF